MTHRLPAEEDLRAIKTAFRLLVSRVGGVLAATACVRVSHAQIARYYDLGDTSTYPPADVVAVLEAVAGAPLVTAEIARLSSHRLVPLDAADGEQLAAAVASFARHAGDVPAALCEGLADGRLTAAELAEIGRRAAQQAQDLVRIAAQAALLAAQDSPATPVAEGEGAPADRRPPGGGDGGRQTPRGSRP
ncbi:hypothetical protein [Falsiroseomonas sp. CW058]|uniref:hypothetical protein n=1 Tax=Falsiroseomonas sp. CW058 TaxID=3388664 RepID=UPI003D310F27